MQPSGLDKGEAWSYYRIREDFLHKLSLKLTAEAAAKSNDGSIRRSLAPRR